MNWNKENTKLLYTNASEKDLSEKLGISRYQVHKKRSELNLTHTMAATAELYAYDIDRLSKSLFYGQQLKITVTVYGASVDTQKEVVGVVREIYPYHVMCESDGKMYSVQLVDIALKNRGLL